MKIKNRVINNASWIIGCKIMQSILSFLIGIFTARYLGPSNYGLISYAASVVAFFSPIMQLGFSATLVQELISQPEKEGSILGTSLVLNIVSAFCCVLGVGTFSAIANPGTPETRLVCILYSFTLVFQASEMTQYWFQAKLCSKYPSVVALVAYVIVSIYKIYLLISEKSIQWFALTHVIEALVIATLLFAVYFRLGGKKLSFSFKLGKEMFSRSKYYIGSAMMVVVFQQTDRIMINLMMGEAETGYYSAALTCVGITGFLFSAIIDSARPAILESKKRSQEEFEDNLVLLYTIITVISLAQSIGMFVLAKLLIGLLYGQNFLQAVPILQVAVWFVAFSYYGSVRNIWILAEQKAKHLLHINLIGACLNVCLNFVLIPFLGGCGAAIATLITQFFTNIVFGYIIKPIRHNNSLLIRSLRAKNFGVVVRKLLSFLVDKH